MAMGLDLNIVKSNAACACPADQLHEVSSVADTETGDGRLN